MWCLPNRLLQKQKTHEREPELLKKISKNFALATSERDQVLTIFRAKRRGTPRRRLVMICPGGRKLPQSVLEVISKSAHEHLPMVEHKYSSPTQPFAGVVKLVSRNGEWYIRITDVPTAGYRVHDTDNTAVWEQAVELVCRTAVADKHPDRSLLKLQIGLL